MTILVWFRHAHALLKAVKLTIGNEEISNAPEPSKYTPPAPPTNGAINAGNTVGDTTTVENSVERLIAATTGEVNSDADGHPEQALDEACPGREQEDGQESGAPVSEPETKDSFAPAGEQPTQAFIKYPCIESLNTTIYPGVVSIVEGPASGLKLELQITPAVDTIRDHPMGDGVRENTEEGEMYNDENPVRPILAGLAGDEKLQENGDHATPTSEGFNTRSEQGKITLEAPGLLERSPDSEAGIMGVPSGKWSRCLALYELTGAEIGSTARVEEISLKGKPLQLTSPKPVEGQNGGLAQQGEVAKGEEEYSAPLFPADKPDSSYPPEDSDQNPAQPPLDGSEASAPAELAEKGCCALYKSIQSEDRRAQAPGSEEPAPHHMDAPAQLTIGEDKHQNGEFSLEQIAFILIHLTE